MKEIVSIYTVTEYKTNKQHEEAIIGDGQEAISFLRHEKVDDKNKYPRFSKFVLEGFEIDGNFIPLDIKFRYND